MNINEALAAGFSLGVFSSIAYAFLIFLPEVKRKSDKISKLNDEVAKLNLLLRINSGGDMTDKSLGAKFDADKPMYNLLPANAIDSLAKVLTFGANKYSPNSWQHVPDGLERYRAALLRHTFAIQRGEYLDPESGLPYSAHAMCCCAFINELENK